ncbi:MAG: hypothetical protein JW820_10220, partial [Spirochaetales bacterium]|nr:hypothetical protein [Spirochaetales bacterium]
MVFVITAIAIPSYLQYNQPPVEQELSLMARAEAARAPNQTTWQDLNHFFWSIAIIGLYLVHLAMAGASIEWISTPFIHLFSPLVFSAITYYRLLQLSDPSRPGTHIVTGTPVEITCWIVGILSITFLVARIRMARHKLNFRDIDWDITTPTLFDRTYLELLAYFRPLIYPPRQYRACAQGILVEGWLYDMFLPFDSIHSVDTVRRANIMSSGYYLATSANGLLRIQLAERTEPLFISPKDRDEFLRYCDGRLAPKQSGTRAGDT